MRAKYYYMQYHAHHMVKLAIQHGDLVQPDSCELCNKKGFVEAHHDDYSKPLVVIWLCRSCHLKTHGAKRMIFRRVINASQIVKEYLDGHPEAIVMEARELALLLNVGKSTVNNVQREYKGKNEG